ncbi:MAG: hypothetical protein M5R40_06585 [Anaerolineae bacterium]|nr:hypothetical protein [Anaerolineae bacterium]
MGFAVFCSRLVGIDGAGWAPPAETDPPEAIRATFEGWLALDAALVEAIAQAIRDLNRAPNADPASVAPERLTAVQRADPN